MKLDHFVLEHLSMRTCPLKCRQAPCQYPVQCLTTISWLVSHLMRASSECVGGGDWFVGKVWGKWVGGWVGGCQAGSCLVMTFWFGHAHLALRHYQGLCSSGMHTSWYTNRIYRWAVIATITTYSHCDIVLQRTSWKGYFFIQKMTYGPCCILVCRFVYWTAPEMESIPVFRIPLIIYQSQ